MSTLGGAVAKNNDGADWRRVKHASDVSWRRVGETLILLDFRTSEYFTLEETGAWIWDRVVKGADVDQLAGAMAREFEVDESVARRDVSAFLGELEAQRLIVRE